MNKLTVRDMMTTAVITMRANETVRCADVDMKLANIRHVPVVDDAGRLVGIMSDRDILRSLGAGTTPKVGDIMTRQVRTVQETTPADLAAEILLEHKIGALPVVGEDGHLVGLVTETDFVHIALRAIASGAIQGET